MSTPFGGKRVQVKPPERGVFPLDHDGECRAKMDEYLSCLHKNEDDNYPCRELSKAYLKCRMELGLMAKDSMENLGFSNKEYERIPFEETKTDKEGFLAGLNVQGSRTWKW